jgi:hypothetical protein
MTFDDPIKQKRFDEAIEACANLSPPLTNEEVMSIFGAVMGNGTVMLRCKFYKDEKPQILFSRQFAAHSPSEQK